MKLYYYDKEKNFGDALNLDLIKHMIGGTVEYAEPCDCDMCAIGSILELFFTKSISVKKFFKKTMTVWGSGFIRPESKQKCIPIRKMKVCAVRGKMTLERMQKYLKLQQNVIIGDPGLLCSMLIDVHNINKKYELGIIPHYIDFDSSYLKNIKVKNSTIIDITQSTEVVLRQIAECKCIISSAMHGLIASDSLGIPNIRMILSDKIVGGDYKYDDYYSAFGIKKHNKIDLREKCISDKDIEYIKQVYPISREQVYRKQIDLINSFPYKMSSEFKNRIVDLLGEKNGANNRKNQ